MDECSISMDEDKGLKNDIVTTARSKSLWHVVG
jgi:hypothetical protein